MKGTPEFEINATLVVKNDQQYDCDEPIAKTVFELEMTDFDEDKDLKIRPENFPNICRTCLRKGELISIFNSYVDLDSERIQIEQLLEESAKVEVTENDDLPQNVCVVCIRKLIKIHTFRKQCNLNEITLNLAKSTLNNTDNDEQKSLSDFEEKYNDIANLLKEENSMDELQNDVNTSNNNNTKEPVYSEDNLLKSNQKAKASTVKHKMVKKPFESLHKCTVCQTTYNTYAELQAHGREAHHSAQHRLQTCQVCHKTILRNSMKEHMYVHAKQKPYRCVHCKKRFAHSSNLKRHMKIHTGERPYVCEVCGKAFGQSTTLLVHRKRHDKILSKKHEKAESVHESDNSSLPDRYFCGPCGRPFKKLLGYQVHMRGHNPDSEKPYACKKCGKSFLCSSAVYSHLKVHGEKSYICTYCDKGFYVKKNLQVHLRLHTGEKPYTCKICQRSFTQDSTYVSHMRIHTGDKPFACHLCSKTFTQPQHLKYHLTTHSKERPYVCHYCGKAFSFKGNLTVHMRRHTNETPYLCEVCGKGFYDSSSRSKHIKRTHNIDMKVEMHKEVGEPKDEGTSE